MKAALPFLFIPLALYAQDSDRSELGEIIVTAKASQDDPNRVSSQLAEDLQRNDLAEAIDLIPGASLQRTGNRAETGITLRGFDLRQVPVFIDGIPVYIPYDGYADLGRFSLPADSEIEVAKGISPVLAGPNALGGLINIVTRRPEKPFEGQIDLGAFSGDGWQSRLAAGGKYEKAYWQLDLSYREQDAFVLSDDFKRHANENGGDRENSYSEDWRASGRIAWTPAATDEHVFGFWIQRGEKGNPPYAGDDPSNNPTRYWQWPQWDKTTFYGLSRTYLGHETTLEAKAHYDRFENLLRSFDNDGYDSQTLGRAFDSYYDDYTAGGSVTLTNESLPGTRLATAIHYKLDHHEEWEPGTPHYNFEDETASVGLEAEHDFHHGTFLTAGVSYDWRDVREAVDTNTGSSLGGDSTDSWNPQITLRQEFSDQLSAHLGFSEKSRFPTIKDRYSYRLGQAIPNPDLAPETAEHYDLGLSGNFLEKRFSWDASLFFSRVDDAIQRVDNVTPGVYQLQNVGEVERKGAEFSFDAKWNEQIETSIRYAWIDAQNRSDSSIPVTGTPENDLLVFARIKPHEKVTLIPSFTWSDSRTTSTTGARVGSYMSFDLKTNLELTENTTLGFGVTNLLDRNQELDEGYPEPGRSYFVNLRYEF
ncbi:TonB-dependent receptor [Luteolibacter pohnpeiensis]|uniref:TonB-dependent receptor n=1 Tax=Luteolibacter pohnpeiensis TaxID=454153 RepID=A0A934S5Y5_9BACT|nr:TonB-dependent receptor [Luteolibacter pohnpeiensis]MBK1881371.1 TonB-dependent receptor [Luteolibacter pohnpeiensis]